jgi:hypothetical protein
MTTIIAGISAAQLNSAGIGTELSATKHYTSSILTLLNMSWIVANLNKLQRET